MKENLNNKIQGILNSNEPKEVKSIKLIMLAESAFSCGDMKAYKFIMDEVVKLNPNLKEKAKPIFLTKDTINQNRLPDIDVD